MHTCSQALIICAIVEQKVFVNMKHEKTVNILANDGYHVVDNFKQVHHKKNKTIRAINRSIIYLVLVDIQNSLM